MSDTDVLLRILDDHSPEYVSHARILEWCNIHTGHGMTVHSRAAELRKPPYSLTVECKMETRRGRRVSFYRLVG